MSSAPRTRLRRRCIDRCECTQPMRRRVDDAVTGVAFDPEAHRHGPIPVRRRWRRPAFVPRFRVYRRDSCSFIAKTIPYRPIHSDTRMAYWNPCIHSSARGDARIAFAISEESCGNIRKHSCAHDASRIHMRDASRTSSHATHPDVRIHARYVSTCCVTMACATRVAAMDISVRSMTPRTSAMKFPLARAASIRVAVDALPRGRHRACPSGQARGSGRVSRQNCLDSSV